MVKKREHITVTITGYTSEGQGVARHPEGMAVFVTDAIAGEVAEVEIDHVGKTAAHGHIVKLLEVSPHRVNRACPIGKRCGGCNFWHMDYEEELRLKGQRVRDAISRIGGVDPGEVTVLPGTMEGYRNKAQFPVGASDFGQPVAGFYMARSHEILPVQRCRIQDPRADAVKTAVMEWMELENISAYDEGSQRGLVRHIYVRAASTGTLVCIVANGGVPEVADTLLQLLQAAVPDLVGLVWNINRRPGNSVLGDRFETLWGQGYLEETLCGLKFRLSPRSFFQVNRQQAQRLYDTALELAQLDANTTALDLYCGTGTITLCMARKAGKVYGVEIIDAAIADAWENAKRNGIDNVEFFCADAGQAAERFAREGVAPQVIMVDPPRKGLSPAVVDAMAQMAPERIVYVSCDPATLARDIGLLQEKDYVLHTTKAVDMFPRCAHVETVVLLSKLNTKQHIEVELNLDELDLTAAESKATYEEIKEYVLEKHGLKVSSLYISQVKRKCGLDVGSNYNLSKKEDAKVPQCPPEKEAAIMEALKHFQMI